MPRRLPQSYFGSRREVCFDKGVFMPSDLLYWVWLSQRLGPGSRKLPGLVSRFDSAYEIYRADDEEITGFDADGNEKLYNLANKDLDEACRTVEYCSANGIEIITYASPRYPSKLRKLQDPPAVLYLRGRLPELEKRLAIAVVGTRKMSEYGKASAYKIAYELASAGALVVSGMALGVDAMAACGALSAKGETIAVFGCGVERTYPAKHKRLMSKILENGCVISEYPPHTEPRGYNFPMRNRIISGLCSGTLVVEADESSGAMITARDAILQGRDIFALPGNIDAEGSQGTNLLIREGAQPIRSAHDILENYRELYSDVLSFRKLEKAEHRSDYDPARASYYGLDYAENGKKDENVSKKTNSEEKGTKEINNVAFADIKPSQVPKNEAVVASLDEKLRRVYDALKEGEDTRLEDLVSRGFSTAQAMAALTVLEIKGLIEKKPGGVYMKK